MKLNISILIFNILFLVQQNSICQSSFAESAGCTLFLNFDNVGITGPTGAGTCGGVLVEDNILKVSHGTPRPVPNGCTTGIDPAQTNGILMGINGLPGSSNQPNTCGEGIFLNFTFRPDRFYTISFGTNLTTNSPNANLYRLNFVAANSLSNLGVADCDNDGDACENNAPVITGPNRQVVGNPIGFDVLSTSTTCTFTTIQFSPNATYSQLLIFPDHIGTQNNGNLGIIIDNICISEYCMPNDAVVFSNTSSPFPSGIHSHETIETNSLGNPGFVRNNPNSNTTFIGGKHVIFKHNTSLTANSGFFFHAYVDQCANYNFPPLMVSNENGESAIAQSNHKDVAKTMDAFGEGSFMIVPNPNSGDFQLFLSQINTSESKDITVKVFSIAGQEIFSSKISEQNTKLGLSGHPSIQNGIYFITLMVDGKKAGTRKFIVSK